MRFLIVPMCGESRRYYSIRPKYMMTCYDGELVLEKCLKSLKNNFKYYDKIYFIALKDHIQKFNVKSIIDNAMRFVNCKKYDVIFLNESKSQVHTVNQGLRKIFNEYEEDFSFIIKDVDNAFEYNECKDKNFVCYKSISKDINDNTDLRNKSYIKPYLQMHGEGVSEIKEKEIISDKFCVGGYSFESAKNFLNYSKNMEYISQVIAEFLYYGNIFNAIEVKNFLDLGTIREYAWYNYINSLRVMGVLK